MSETSGLCGSANFAFGVVVWRIDSLCIETVVAGEHERVVKDAESVSDEEKNLIT